MVNNNDYYQLKAFDVIKLLIANRHLNENSFNINQKFIRNQKHLSMNEVKKSIISNEKIEIVYFNPDPQIVFNYYDLICVPQADLNNRLHYIFSHYGVLEISMVNGKQMNQLIALDEWYKEAIQWKSLRHIPFFKDFLLRKLFHMWRHLTTLNRSNRIKENLSSNLHLLKNEQHLQIIQVNDAIRQLISNVEFEMNEIPKRMRNEEEIYENFTYFSNKLNNFTKASNILRKIIECTSISTIDDIRYIRLLIDIYMNGLLSILPSLLTIIYQYFTNISNYEIYLKIEEKNESFLKLTYNIDWKKMLEVMRNKCQIGILQQMIAAFFIEIKIIEKKIKKFVEVEYFPSPSIIKERSFRQLTVEIDNSILNCQKYKMKCEDIRFYILRSPSILQSILFSLHNGEKMNLDDESILSINIYKLLKNDLVESFELFSNNIYIFPKINFLRKNEDLTLPELLSEFLPQFQQFLIDYHQTLSEINKFETNKKISDNLKEVYAQNRSLFEYYVEKLMDKVDNMEQLEFVHKPSRKHLKDFLVLLGNVKSVMNFQEFVKLSQLTMGDLMEMGIEFENIENNLRTLEEEKFEEFKNLINFIPNHLKRMNKYFDTIIREQFESTSHPTNFEKKIAELIGSDEIIDLSDLSQMLNEMIIIIDEIFSIDFQYEQSSTKLYDFSNFMKKKDTEDFKKFFSENYSIVQLEEKEEKSFNNERISVINIDEIGEKKENNFNFDNIVLLKLRKDGKDLICGVGEMMYENKDISIIDISDEMMMKWITNKIKFEYQYLEIGKSSFPNNKKRIGSFIKTQIRFLLFEQIRSNRSISYYSNKSINTIDIIYCRWKLTKIINEIFTKSIKEQSSNLEQLLEQFEELSNKASMDFRWLLSPYILLINEMTKNWKDKSIWKYWFQFQIKLGTQIKRSRSINDEMGNDGNNPLNMFIVIDSHYYLMEFDDLSMNLFLLTKGRLINLLEMNKELVNKKLINCHDDILKLIYVKIFGRQIKEFNRNNQTITGDHGTNFFKIDQFVSKKLTNLTTHLNEIKEDTFFIVFHPPGKLFEEYLLFYQNNYRLDLSIWESIIDSYLSQNNREIIKDILKYFRWSLWKEVKSMKNRHSTLKNFSQTSRHLMKHILLKFDYQTGENVREKFQKSKSIVDENDQITANIINNYFLMNHLNYRSELFNEELKSFTLKLIEEDVYGVLINLNSVNLNLLRMLKDLSELSINRLNEMGNIDGSLSRICYMKLDEVDLEEIVFSFYVNRKNHLTKILIFVEMDDRFVVRSISSSLQFPSLNKLSMRMEFLQKSQNVICENHQKIWKDIFSDDNQYSNDFYLFLMEIIKNCQWNIESCREELELKKIQRNWKEIEEKVGNYKNLWKLKRIGVNNCFLQLFTMSINEILSIEHTSSSIEEVKKSKIFTKSFSIPSIILGENDRFVCCDLRFLYESIDSIQFTIDYINYYLTLIDKERPKYSVILIHIRTIDQLIKLDESIKENSSKKIVLVRHFCEKFSEGIPLKLKSISTNFNLEMTITKLFDDFQSKLTIIKNLKEFLLSMKILDEKRQDDNEWNLHEFDEKTKWKFLFIVLVVCDTKIDVYSLIDIRQFFYEQTTLWKMDEFKEILYLINPQKYFSKQMKENLFEFKLLQRNMMERLSNNLIMNRLSISSLEGDRILHLETYVKNKVHSHEVVVPSTERDDQLIERTKYLIKFPQQLLGDHESIEEEKRKLSNDHKEYRKFQKKYEDIVKELEPLKKERELLLKELELYEGINKNKNYVATIGSMNLRQQHIIELKSFRIVSKECEKLLEFLCLFFNESPSISNGKMLLMRPSLYSDLIFYKHSRKTDSLILERIEKYLKKHKKALEPCILINISLAASYLSEWLLALVQLFRLNSPKQRQLDKLRWLNKEIRNCQRNLGNYRLLALELREDYNRNIGIINEKIKEKNWNCDRMKNLNERYDIEKSGKEIVNQFYDEWNQNSVDVEEMEKNRNEKFLNLLKTCQKLIEFQNQLKEDDLTDMTKDITEENFRLYLMNYLTYPVGEDDELNSFLSNDYYRSIEDQQINLKSMKHIGRILIRICFNFKWREIRWNILFFLLQFPMNKIGLLEIISNGETFPFIIDILSVNFRNNKKIGKISEFLVINETFVEISKKELGELKQQFEFNNPISLIKSFRVMMLNQFVKTEIEKMEIIENLLHVKNFSEDGIVLIDLVQNEIDDCLSLLLSAMQLGSLVIMKNYDLVLNGMLNDKLEIFRRIINKLNDLQMHSGNQSIIHFNFMLTMYVNEEFRLVFLNEKQIEDMEILGISFEFHPNEIKMISVLSYQIGCAEIYYRLQTGNDGKFQFLNELLIANRKIRKAYVESEEWKERMRKVFFQIYNAEMVKDDLSKERMELEELRRMKKEYEDCLILMDQGRDTIKELCFNGLFDVESNQVNFVLHQICHEIDKSSILQLFPLIFNSINHVQHSINSNFLKFPQQLIHLAQMSSQLNHKKNGPQNFQRNLKREPQINTDEYRSIILQIHHKMYLSIRLEKFVKNLLQSNDTFVHCHLIPDDQRSNEEKLFNLLHQISDADHHIFLVTNSQELFHTLHQTNGRTMALIMKKFLTFFNENLFIWCFDKELNAKVLCSHYDCRRLRRIILSKSICRNDEFIHLFE
ncbi:hypothetical protein SNEBB_003509 [Seison nebaliae]|nr:hypothetical protein SNEBB_003509 [Seison nebaliae]